MKNLQVWFANLKLQYKLMLAMAGVTTLALLAITATTCQNYFSMNFAAEMEKSEQAVNRAANSLHRTFSSLTLKTSRTLLEPTMKLAILQLGRDNRSHYADNYQGVSAIMDSYVNSSDTLVSAYLFSPFVLYGTVSAGDSQNPYGIINGSFWDLSAITYLPSNHNGRTKAAQVVPILFPVTSLYTTNGQILDYGASEHNQPVCFAVFFDERHLNETLSRFSTSMTDGFYVLGREGRPLNHNFGTLGEDIQAEISAYVMERQELRNAPFSTRGDTFYISSQPIGTGGLRIVHVFSRSSIMDSMKPMLLFLILIWVLGIAASCALSFVIARSLTRPFRTLTGIIEQINHNSYWEKTEFLYHDESGLLGKQINQMYDTIQQQILVIKEEEQQKARAEIQMYTEQVNPHFLYNTLECIHFQMLNEHREAACLMLNSLAKYLRLTLSHGQTMHPLSKEIEHVTEYMAIINRHSAASRIAFTCNCGCSEALKAVHIPKLLLQPIAENAIKHGFPKDLTSYMAPPAISIDIAGRDGAFYLKVTDNGQGFDIHYASQCMRDGAFENGRHFGLHNIYQRLSAYYGEAAEIHFESIPYYMNSVVIRIPLAM